MNSLSVSTEPQPEIPIWHPGIWAAYNSGIDPRQGVQSGKFGSQWEDSGIAIMPSRHHETDAKPAIATNLLPASLRSDYHVVHLNNLLPPTTHNSAGESMEGSFHSFYPSLPSLAALDHADSNARNYNAYIDMRSGSEVCQNQNPLLGLLNWDQRFHDIVKREFYSPEYATSLGLNLSGRTYFSSEDAAANFFKRFRANPPDAQLPACQAGGCKADLRLAKHYHRRHKVCEFHSKAATVLIGDLTQRFCQQCSRFHVLSEFDEGKRSCRKRLADHNRRRRKPQPTSATTNGSTPSDQSTRKKKGESEGNVKRQRDDEAKPTSHPTAKPQISTFLCVASSSAMTSRNAIDRPAGMLDSESHKAETSKAPYFSPSAMVDAKVWRVQPSPQCPVSWLKTASTPSNSMDPSASTADLQANSSPWVVESMAEQSHGDVNNPSLKTHHHSAALNLLQSHDMKNAQCVQNDDQTLQISLGHLQERHQFHVINGTNPLKRPSSYD